MKYHAIFSQCTAIEKIEIHHYLLSRDSVMTYQEALTQEINSLPPALLSEVLDFVLFLKIKARTPDNHLSNKIRDLQFQQELQALSQAYRARLSKEGKLEQNAEKVMAALKQTREEIAANEYCQ